MQPAPQGAAAVARPLIELANPLLLRAARLNPANSAWAHAAANAAPNNGALFGAALTSALQETIYGRAGSTRDDGSAWRNRPDREG